jgi:hypothetical protein
MAAAESKDAAIPCLEARRQGRERAGPEVCGSASHTSEARHSPRCAKMKEKSGCTYMESRAE